MADPLPLGDIDASVDAYLRQQSGQGAAIRQNLADALPVNPDQEATLRRAASATVTPISAARADPEYVKTQAQVQSVDTDGLAQQAPNLGRWLAASPDNAKIAHDDLPQLAQVDQHTSSLGSPGANIGPDTTPPSYGSRLSGWFRDLVGLPPAGRDDAEAARAFLALEAKRQGVGVGDLREAVGGASEIPTQFASNFLSSFMLAPDAAGKAQTTAGGVAGGAGSLAGFIAGLPLGVGKALVEKVGGAALEKTAGEAWIKGLGKDVAGQAATLGIAGGIGAIPQALNTGTPGDAALTIAKAAGSNATTGAAFGSVGRIFPDNTLAQLGARFLANSALLDTISGQRPWDDRPIAQKVFDYGLNAFFSLGGAGRTAGGWLHDAARADLALTDAEKLQALADAAGSSKLRERDPDLFKQFVADASVDAPIKSVWVDGTRLAEALHQSGIGTDEIAAKLPQLRPQLEEALATGGQVEIPVEDFATHIAGTDLQKELMPHLRTDPEGMSQDEAKQFYQSHVDQLRAEAERIAAEQAGNQPFLDSQQQVHDNVLAQLEATGRFRPEVNAAYAALTRDFYTTMAERTGQMPHELFADQPLTIARGTTEDSVLQQTMPSRVPTSTKVAVDLNEINLPDLETLSRNQVQLDKAVSAVAADPGMGRAGETPDAETLVERMKQNLLWLHDQVPPEIAARSKLWYDGAQRIAQGWSEKWNKTRAQTAGVLAVLSPQKDWFMNTTMAERVGDILTERMDHAWDKDMSAAAFKFLVGDAGKADPDAAKNTRAFESAKGKTLKEVVDAGDKRAIGIWIRAYDEAHHGTSHAIITPEGGFAGPKLTDAGKEARRAWGDFSAIGKAASIFVDGSPENISTNLGGEHKVRNFYNNIFNASDPRFTTIDTHAVAAAQLRPLAGADKAVADNFGKTGGDNATGISGSYPLYYEAYKRAAAERGILPREMQSITWEAVRGLFPDTFKTAENKKAIDAIHAQVSAGSMPIEQARQAISDLAGGIRNPDWWQGDNAHLNEALNDKTYVQGRTEPTGARVTFEVAPDPNDTALKAKWDALDPAAKEEVSHKIAWNIAAKAMATAFKTGAGKDLVLKGELHQQSGGYGPDTNPSLSIWLDPNTSPTKALELAKVLGHALNQDSMMVTSPKAFKGGEEWGTIVIQGVPEDPAPLYNELREALGGDAISGHTTAQGTMVILAPKEAAEQTARAVQEHLGDRHDVGHGTISVAWPDKGDGYGLAGQSGSAEGGAEASVRAAADRLRSEASALLADAVNGAERSPLDTAHAAAGSADAADVDRFAGESPAFAQSDGAKLLGDLLKPRKQVDARGLYAPDSRTITLLKGADLTTFLHESGHFYLDMLTRLADRPDAPQSIKDDAAKALEFMGHGDKDVAAWRALPIDEQRVGHEAFARGFEKYLLEGKAPNQELRTLFQRFRSWLVQAYQSLRGINVELTPEVRGVFDRMLATDKAIDSAEQARKMVPMFATAPEGMSQADWLEYQKLGADATATAVEGLTARTVSDMAWSDRVRSAALRDLQKDAAEKRKVAQREVEREVDQQPVYGAMRFLKRGEIVDKDGQATEVQGPHRLDIHALGEIFGGEGDPYALLDWSKLGYGKYGMLGEGENALHPDMAAEMHGFASGREMVEALLDAPPRREVVRQMTEQRVLEKHGDIANPVDLAKAADEAVHNAVRTRFVAAELRALDKSKGPARVLANAAREVAEATIGGKPVRDLSERPYLAAEARASQRALDLLKKGDLAGAAVAKRDQLLNMELARAALKAQKATDAGVKYLRRFTGNNPARDKIDLDIRDQIDQLLERFDLRSAPTPAPGAAARQRLEDWLAAMHTAGYSPSIPPDLLNPDVRQHFKDMPFERLSGLVDTVKALEHVGKERKTLSIEGAKHDLDQFVRERVVPKLESVGERFTPDELLERPENRRSSKVAIALDHFTSWLRGAAAQLKPQEFKRNQYDRHEILGPFGEAITDPVMNANYAKVRMLKELSNDFQKAADELGRKWQDSMRDDVVNQVLADPDQPGKMLRITRGRMVGMAIHVGNESNLAKLTRGWGWDGGTLMKFLDANMSEKDWKAVQTVWDLYEKHWPDMEAMNRRLGNTMPDKIQARPFTTRFGEMRGGYAAIRYDPLRSKRGEKDQAMRAIDPSEGLFGRDYFRADTTTNGSLNNRAEGYTDRVDLDFHTIPQVMQQSIHDLAYRETLINANKVIDHPDFRRAFKSAYGPEAYRSLQEWLGDIANGGNYDRQVGAVGKFLQYTRTGMVINAIAFRATTVLKHGGSAGIKSLGYFAGGGEKYLASRMASMATDYSNQIRSAREKFGEINNRLMQQDRDFKALSSTMFEPDTALAKAHRFGHQAVAWSDMMTAVPTAWAAYDRAVTEGIPVSQGGTGQPMTEAQAVNFANKVVREAHGSTAEAARSQLLNSHSEAIRMFSTLYGFMNNSYGQQLDGFDKLRTAGISNAPVLARTFMAIIVPAIWAGFLTHGAPNQDKGEGWAAWAAKALGSEVASSVPFVRDAVAFAEGYSHAGLVPAENWLASLMLAGKDAVHTAQGTGQGKPVRDISNAVGISLHIPGLGQLGQSAQYIADVQSGKERPQSNWEYAQGVVTGHGPKH